MDLLNEVNDVRFAKLTDAGREFHILMTLLQKKITTNTASVLRLMQLIGETSTFNQCVQCEYNYDIITVDSNNTKYRPNLSVSRDEGCRSTDLAAQ